MQTREPLEQLNDFNKMATNIAKRINDYTLETTNDLLTTSAKQWKELGNVKEMKDILEVNTRIINEMGSKLLNNSQKALNMSLENFTEFSKWLEGSSHFANPMNAMNVMNTMNPNQNKKS